MFLVNVTQRSTMTDPGFISVEPSLSLSKTLSHCQENLSARFLSIAIGLRVRSFPKLPRGHPRRNWLAIVQGSKESHRKRRVPGCHTAFSVRHALKNETVKEKNTVKKDLFTIYYTERL